jgi:hypothetical protein
MSREWYFKPRLITEYEISFPGTILLATNRTQSNITAGPEPLSSTEQYTHKCKINFGVTSFADFFLFFFAEFFCGKVDAEKGKSLLEGERHFCIVCFLSLLLLPPPPLQRDRHNCLPGNHGDDNWVLVPACDLGPGKEEKGQDGGWVWLLGVKKSWRTRDLKLFLAEHLGGLLVHF